MTQRTENEVLKETELIKLEEDRISTMWWKFLLNELL